MQLVADVARYEQGDERADGGADEPCGHLIQALVHHTRIEALVILLVDKDHNALQVRVDLSAVVLTTVDLAAVVLTTVDLAAVDLAAVVSTAVGTSSVFCEAGHAPNSLAHY
jgi:hypothetical protein